MQEAQQPQRGRPALATPESVAKAAAALTAENYPITVRGVMRKIGGSPKRVADLIKQLPQTKAEIKVDVELPDGLSKVWKQAVETQAKVLQDEYQWRLDEMAERLKSERDKVTDQEAELTEMRATLDSIRAEHGALQGRLQAEREMREECQRELAEARVRGEQSNLEAATQRERADMAIAQAATAEQRAADAQRELDAASREAAQLREANAKLEGQIDGGGFRAMLEGASGSSHAPR
jgi:chromosome segregation ATPase